MGLVRFAEGLGRFLGSDKIFFHFFKDFFERATVVVCHAAPCFLSFYRISQPVPRKKINNFCGRAGAHWLPQFHQRCNEKSIVRFP